MIAICVALAIGWLLAILLAVYCGYITDTANKLEIKLHAKEVMICELQREKTFNDRKIEQIQESLDHTPDNCKVGKWCEACAFGKSYYVRGYDGQLVKIYLCGRADRCECFVGRPAGGDQ